MKRCFKCGLDKDIDEFYRQSSMSDGHFGKCKECTKADVTAARLRRPPEELAEYERKRRADPKRRAAQLEYQKNARRDKSIQYKARSLCQSAIRNGRLVPQPCEKCGSMPVEAHHEDHYKPLDVTWLCFKCHSMVHGKKPNSETRFKNQKRTESGDRK